MLPEYLGYVSKKLVKEKKCRKNRALASLSYAYLATKRLTTLQLGTALCYSLPHAAKKRGTHRCNEPTREDYSRCLTTRTSRTALLQLSTLARTWQTASKALNLYSRISSSYVVCCGLTAARALSAPASFGVCPVCGDKVYVKHCTKCHRREHNACIECGKCMPKVPYYDKWERRTYLVEARTSNLYCSNACRQKAYRRRKK
jgi:hypothetical protein